MVIAMLVSLNLSSTSLADDKKSEDGEIRIVAGLGSADMLIEDLEHIVSGLSDRKDSFDDNIFPNIDIFLFGVETTQPIRFDPIFSEEYGMELQPVIPYLDLKDFLNENLDPIGIIPKRNRKDRDLYELIGQVYEGWLRVLKKPNYVVIFPRKEAIPKGMPHPADLHKKLAEKEYLLFAELDNTKSSAEVRGSAFEKMRASAVDGIQKRPDETKAAHTLRKAMLDHQLAIFKQWFVESSGCTLGGKLDKTNDVALTELLFSAIAETQLQKDIIRVREEPSYFTAIDAPKESILTLRLNFKFDENIAAGFRDIYKLSETVAKEQIEEDEKTTKEQKESRAKVTHLVNEVLSKTSELGTVDAFLDIIPSGDAHTFLLGVHCKGQDELLKTLEELPASREGWTVKMDVAESEGVKIHKLDLGGKAPKALADLYGESHGQIYVAVSDKAFWMAFGAAAQEELSAHIKAVRTAEDVESDNVVMSMTAKLGPLAKSLNDLFNDDDSVIGSLVSKRQDERKERREKSEDDDEDEDAEEERPAREAAGAMLSFEWVEKVVGTMEGEDDTITFEMKVDENGVIVGNGEVRKGILKAVGSLIADFADENLQ